MSPQAVTDPLIRAMLHPGVFGRGVRSVELIETHISWVLLTGTFAYKIKKPVRLPFLDFSTLELRHHFCIEELRLNRRLAPELYLDVIPIGGPRESPTLDAEPATEYAVKMREFPAAARLDRQITAGAIPKEAFHAFAGLLAEFHEALPAASAETPYGEPERVVSTVLTNLTETQRYLPKDLAAGDVIFKWTVERTTALRRTLAERKAGGSIKEGHGDLHLENLVYLDKRIVPFDALEFDPNLRWLDVMDEAAFIVMDLLAHGRRDLAFTFLSRYLEITGDYAGLTVLAYYQLYRTLVRAKVRAIKSLQDQSAATDAATAPYLDLARTLLEPRSPVLLLTHGLSGSGKTTVTEHLIPELPAIRLRSDIERKRLFGLSANARSGSDPGEGLYTATTTRRLYATLQGFARLALQSGLNVIVDATFLRREDREGFRRLARKELARFVVLDCAAPEAELRQRIDERRFAGEDPSEATLQVLDHQLRTCELLTEEELEHTVTVDTRLPVAVPELVKRIHACGAPRG